MASLGDFMTQTGGDLQKAQKLFQASIKSGETSIASNLMSDTKATTTTQKVDTSTRTGLTGKTTSYNPYTKTEVKVNKDTAVNTGTYSMQNKQDLWEDTGNSGDFEMDAFYRGDDGSLQIKDSYNQNKTRSVADANAYLNAKQIAEYENRNLPTSTKEGFEAYKESYGEVLKGGQEAPEVYSAVEDLTTRRAQTGIEDIESQLAEIEKNKADLEANTRQRVNYAGDKAVAMGVISGRVSTIEQQGNERMDALNREASYLTDIYNTKMSVIQAYMSAGESDYTRAKQAYDDEYNRNMSLLSAYETKTNTEYTQARQEKLDAQATLQTMYNLVTSGSVKSSEMSETQKATITKLELQSGLPIGTIDQLKSENDTATIVSQSNVSENGNNYLSLVLRDSDGNFSTKKIYIGEAETNTNQLNRYQYKDGQVFDTATGTISSGQEISQDEVSKTIQACRETGQCGEGVNDYLRRIGDSTHFEDEYDQKKSKINSNTPSVGSIAVWQPSGGQPEYGHVGIVVGVDGDTVTVHDWNWGTDEKQQEHSVSNSTINASGGYYVPQSASTQNTAEYKKKEAEIAENVSSEATKLKAKMQQESLSWDDAHDQLYTKYAQSMRSMGVSDKDIKSILYQAMGGKTSEDKYKNVKTKGGSISPLDY